MSPSPDPTRPLRRAVYLSAPPTKDLYRATREVARRLNASGAAVFIDELLISAGEKRVAPHIPSAICYADELLVLLPQGSSPRPDLQTFPRRDYLIIALTAAHIRNIPTAVFLPRPLSAGAVLDSDHTPPFLTDGRLIEEGAWEEYYRQLADNPPPPNHGAVQAYLKLGNGLRVCLCWVGGGQPRAARTEGGKMQRMLDKYGLGSELVVWTREGGHWTPSHIPREQFDALAVCARGDEPGPWADARFQRLLARVRGERSPVLFVQRDGIESPLPEDFRDDAQFEWSRHTPEGQVLALVRGLIGFKDWRPSHSPAPGMPGTGETPQQPPAGAGRPHGPELGSESPAEGRSGRAGPEDRGTDGGAVPKVKPGRLGPKADVVYAVFCRIDGIRKMAADRLAASVEALQAMVASAVTDPMQAYSSVYGRFVLVPSRVTDALALALRLQREGAAAGVPLAIGVTAGRVEETRDLVRPGVAGPVVNLAARLANLERGVGRVAVDEQTYQDATAAAVRYSPGRFGELEHGRVKRTELAYRMHKDRAPRRGPPPAVQPHHTPEVAHVVVYDIVRYSEMAPLDLAPRVGELTLAVERALDAAGGQRLVDGTDGWYAPAGDGGVLVFRDVRGGGRAALSVIGALLNHTPDRVSIRIGATTGQVVVLPDNLPVGKGILQADDLSAKAAEGRPCVSRRFWEQSLDRPDHRGWVTDALPAPEQALLIRRHESD